MKFKKLLSVTLSVILIVSLLSSCKNTGAPTIESTSSEQEEKITLAETIEKTEAAAIYKLGDDIKVDSSNADIVVSDRLAHIFFNLGDTTKVVTFSVYENSLLSEVTVTGASLNYGALDGGQFFAINRDTATLFVFEKSGELKKEKKICESALRFGLLDSTGQFLIYQKTDSALINRIDLLTDEIKESQEEFNISGTPVCHKDTVYLKENSGKHYKISFENFEFTKTVTEAFKEYVDCMGVAVEGNYFTLTALNGSEKTMTEKLSDEEIIAAGDQRFITVNPTKNQFRLYNLNTTFATEKISAPGNGLESMGTILDAQFVEEDYILLALEDTNTSENYYRLFKISDNEDKVSISAGRLNEGEIYKNVFGEKDTEAEKLAKEVYEKYNVRFLYGKVGKDFKTDFSFTNADGVDVIPKLKVVEKIFDVLPQELLMEATADREIWVYFCNELDNKGMEYTKDAVLTQLYNHNLILINAAGVSDNKFAELLCHEFAHILDNYMPEKVKNGFSNLTPQDIKSAAYTNDYKKLPSDQYTPYDKDKSNVWFYNNYCRINEKEDRVITLGEMFKIYTMQFSGENLSYENVKKKTAYLSKALEESFDFAKEYENQHWELAFPYNK